MYIIYTTIYSHSVVTLLYKVVLIGALISVSYSASLALTAGRISRSRINLHPTELASIEEVYVHYTSKQFNHD